MHACLGNEVHLHNRDLTSLVVWRWYKDQGHVESFGFFLHYLLYYTIEFFGSQQTSPLCREKVLPVFLAQVLTSMIVPEAWASTSSRRPASTFQPHYPPTGTVSE